MADIVREYLSTPPSTRQGDPDTVFRWLQSLQSQAFTALGSVSDSIRSKFCKALLADLAQATGTRQGIITLNCRTNSKWSSKLRLSALAVLKELSRLPGGSAPLAEQSGLECLLLQVDFPLQSSSPTPSPTSPTSPGNASNPAYSRGGSGRRSKPSTPTKDALSSFGSSSIQSQSLQAQEPDWTVTDMALRCINNVLFLQESSRALFVSDEVRGGHAAVNLLAAPKKTPVDILFLGARLLFFATLFESPFNKTAVEKLNVIAIEASCTQALTQAIVESDSPSASSSDNVLQQSGTTARFTTALSDLLKAHFNICLYYPRLAGNSALPTDTQERAIVGEGFHEALDGMLDPILSVVALLPPSSPAPLTPPVTHAIAALLNYPMQGYQHRWASTSTSTLATGDQSNGPSSPTSTSLPSSSSARKLADSVSSMFTNRGGNNGSSGSGTPLWSKKSKILSGESIASTISLTLTRSQSRRSSKTSIHDVVRPPVRFGTDISASSSSALEAAPPVLAKLLVLADKVLERYLSAQGQNASTDAHATVVEDPDSKTVKATANSDGLDLEETAQPLLLLLRKMAAEHDESRKTIRAILLPNNDLDRSKSIDKRLDLVGRLVRLMSSVTLPRLARAAGELLLATCDLDPKTMTDTIGYGPCAGFLMNSGLASALPKGSGDGAPDAQGRTINPITGQYNPTAEELAADEISQMTDAEKEAEAEKLFTLFERMNRTGVINVQNPAADSGRFEEVVEEEERKKQEEEEEEDERIVEREMAERKRRMEAARRRAQALAAKSPQNPTG